MGVYSRDLGFEPLGFRVPDAGLRDVEGSELRVLGL